MAGADVLDLPRPLEVTQQQPTERLNDTRAQPNVRPDLLHWVASPRTALEDLARPRDEADWQRLGDFAQKTSENAWPEVKTHDEWRDQVKTWSTQQTEWIQTITETNQKLAADIELVVRNITGPQPELGQPNQTDWVAFYDKVFVGTPNPVKNFVNLLNEGELTELKDKKGAIKALAGIFGADVVRELFDEKAIKQDETEGAEARRESQPAAKTEPRSESPFQDRLPGLPQEVEVVSATAGHQSQHIETGRSAGGDVFLTYQDIEGVTPEMIKRFGKLYILLDTASTQNESVAYLQGKPGTQASYDKARAALEIFYGLRPATKGVEHAIPISGQDRVKEAYDYSSQHAPSVDTVFAYALVNGDQIIGGGDSTSKVIFVRGNGDTNYLYNPDGMSHPDGEGRSVTTLGPVISSEVTKVDDGSYILLATDGFNPMRPDNKRSLAETAKQNEAWAQSGAEIDDSLALRINL